MLKFSKQNAKTKNLQNVVELQPYLANKRKIYSLDLLSGWSCPGACDCLAKVHDLDGKRKLKDGPKTQFRCFSASQEVVYPPVYNARLYNFNILRGCCGVTKCRDMILQSIPTDLGILRYHVGGDFFKLAYLRAAIEVAEAHPDRLFYAYTKSLPHLSKIDMQDPSSGIIRPNFLITTSRGGKYDYLIGNTRTATVVYDDHQAGGLPIDHDDSHAATVGGSFALLLHGVQPKGSNASKVLAQLKGRGSYRRI